MPTNNNIQVTMAKQLNRRGIADQILVDLNVRKSTNRLTDELEDTLISYIYMQNT